MKKLTPRYRRRLIYWSQNSKKRKRFRIATIVGGQGIELVKAPVSARVMPQQFCLSTNPEETIAFLNDLRGRILRPPRSGVRAVETRLRQDRKKSGAPKWIGPYVDFSNIHYISASAALVLAAEYHRSKILISELAQKLVRLFVVDVERWTPDVLISLFDVGFFDLLDITEESAEFAPPDADQRILKFRSGKKSEAAQIDKMLDDLEGMFSVVGLNANDACFELNGALGEAMENAVSRAYPGNVAYQHPHVGRWWMTGSCTKSTRRLNAAIFDQGVSIPGSLRNWQYFSSFSSRFLRVVGLEPNLEDHSHDGRVIEMAIAVSASSTNEEKHGKGLGHIKAFVDSCSEGRLTIISRRGYYSYTKGEEPVVKSVSHSLGGTLVEWDVVI